MHIAQEADEQDALAGPGWKFAKGFTVTDSRRRSCWLLLAVLSLAGCEKQPPAVAASPDTGAQAAARTFFEALMREEWSNAYDTLDAESRGHISKEMFAGRAKAAMKQLGFVPTDVGVTVSETGDRASALAVYRGLSGTTPKQFKDGMALKRTGQVWHVVLRSNFGIGAASPANKGGQGGKR